jgi:hypothetical protein
MKLRSIVKEMLSNAERAGLPNIKNEIVNLIKSDTGKNLILILSFRPIEASN